MQQAGGVARTFIVGSDLVQHSDTAAGRRTSSGKVLLSPPESADHPLDGHCIHRHSGGDSNTFPELVLRRANCAWQTDEGLDIERQCHFTADCDLEARHHDFATYERWLMSWLMRGRRCNQAGFVVFIRAPLTDASAAAASSRDAMPANSASPETITGAREMVP